MSSEEIDLFDLSDTPAPKKSHLILIIIVVVVLVVLAVGGIVLYQYLTYRIPELENDKYVWSRFVKWDKAPAKFNKKGMAPMNFVFLGNELDVNYTYAKRKDDRSIAIRTAVKTIDDLEYLGILNPATYTTESDADTGNLNIIITAPNTYNWVSFCIAPLDTTIVQSDIYNRVNFSINLSYTNELGSRITENADLSMYIGSKGYRMVTTDVVSTLNFDPGRAVVCYRYSLQMYLLNGIKCFKTSELHSLMIGNYYPDSKNLDYEFEAPLYGTSEVFKKSTLDTHMWVVKPFKDVSPYNNNTKPFNTLFSGKWGNWISLTESPTMKEISAMSLKVDGSDNRYYLGWNVSTMLLYVEPVLSSDTDTNATIPKFTFTDGIIEADSIIFRWVPIGTCKEVSTGNCLCIDNAHQLDKVTFTYEPNNKDWLVQGPDMIIYTTPIEYIKCDKLESV